MASQKNVTRVIDSSDSNILSSETDSDFGFSSDVDACSDADTDTCSGAQNAHRGDNGRVDMSTTHIVEADGSTTIIENGRCPGVIFFGGNVGHVDMSSMHMSREDKIKLDEAAAKRNKTAFTRYNKMYEEVQDELEEVRAALDAKQSEYAANPTTELEAECRALRQREENTLFMANVLEHQLNMLTRQLNR